jgi:dihydroxy-acid dehydratase
MHLLDLAKKVKEGCEAEGMLGLTFNTIGVRFNHSIAFWFKP